MILNATKTRQETGSVAELVQSRVDLLKVYPFSPRAKQFEGYYRDRCISPDHADDQASMLIHPTSVYCMACGYHRSTLYALYQAHKVAQRERIQRTGESEDRINIHFLADELLGGNYGFDDDYEPPQRDERVVHTSIVAGAVQRLWASEEYLQIVRSFGFADEAIRHWKLGIQDVIVNISDDDALPVYEKQTRISFPVFSNGRCVQEIHRKLTDNQRGGKIQMRKGHGSHLINREVLTTGQPVLVVEGWGDVIALWQLGIAAVSSSNGAGHWNNEWFEDLGECTNLYASGDADAAGEGLITRIQKRCPWVKLIRPPFEAGTKGDWRDFVKAGGTRQQIEALMRRGRINVVLDKLRRTDA